MGNISSRPDDGSSLYLRDQTRFSVASLVVTNARRKVLLNVVPNSFPATRLSAKRDIGDDAPVEYIQDPDTLTPTTGPSFLLRLTNDDELNFRFTFFIRQTSISSSASPKVNGQSAGEVTDTSITGLTFAYASTTRELDNLVTREFHANPNLHKNSNVQLVGDYTTDGSPAVQFEWCWKWKPPKSTEDKGGGWRNSCSFLEYDSRAHRLNTLAAFSFWVHNAHRPQITPLSSPSLELNVPPRLRLPSSQSIQSRVSENETLIELPEPPSPIDVPTESGSTLAASITSTTNASIKVDVACARPGEDLSAVEDGPVFRATMKALEQKTSSMRARMKKVLKKAEAAQLAQVESNQSIKAFLSALQEASSSNASAIKPALDHYFNQIAQQILTYETQNSVNLQRLIIDPLSKLYNLDIKQAESKKKDFEDESRDYYAYVSRYLGQRQDSLKEKKRAESDSKYQTKRRNFELRRFDYSSFMQDLHGGRKEQEMLSQLTKYADNQAQSFLSTAKKIEEMTPQLEALIREVGEVDKEFRFQRTEREEKRRLLEKSTTSYTEPDSISHNFANAASASQATQAVTTSDSELGRADSTGSQLRHGASVKSVVSQTTNGGSLNPPIGTALSTSPSAVGSSPGQNRFKGIRDLEERDNSSLATDKTSAEQKKEGLLWALSRPGSHIDPKGINKQAWHKFWIVLDQGRLSEYSNWKQKLDLHMEPIDLRMASVRIARDAERRFCFEVITPHFKRVYQATSEDDMSNWITAINNALQSAVELGGPTMTPIPSRSRGVSPGRDLGSVLTGKSSSYSGQHGYSHRTESNSVGRRITVGARPSYIRTNSNSYEENPSKLLQQIRDADQGNCYCADCGSGSKVEWVSINLAIILCIECSGIHRSLGTHISKVRSLTLDIHSFSNDIVELLIQIGNRVSNMVWEATLDQSQKPTAASSREQRLKFINAKYSERAYVRPITPGLSHYSSPDETLLASIKKNDICGVLYGIALHGNVNAQDRSRHTHAAFLALAAADPAAPGGFSPAVSPTNKNSGSAAKQVPFAMAELLVQNGAEIPQQMPAIPLSPAAKLYVEQRTGRGGTIPGQDTVGALPTIRGVGGGHGFSGPVEKEREAKLQKRGSAGSRFAGKMAALGDRTDR